MRSPRTVLTETDRATLAQMGRRGIEDFHNTGNLATYFSIVLRVSQSLVLP